MWETTQVEKLPAFKTAKQTQVDCHIKRPSVFHNPKSPTKLKVACYKDAVLA